MKRIRLNAADCRKVAEILTDLDLLALEDLAECIAQAMELEQGHDRAAAYAIAAKATKSPELFLMH